MYKYTSYIIHTTQFYIVHLLCDHDISLCMSVPANCIRYVLKDERSEVSEAVVGADHLNVVNVVSD